MPHVVTPSCIRCKTTDCVGVCPVDCFHEGPNMLVIDPVECIDCGVCIDECPVDAIYYEDALPTALHNWIVLNRDLSQKWPVISQQKDPFPDWEYWAEETDKERYFEDHVTSRPT